MNILSSAPPTPVDLNAERQIGMEAVSFMAHPFYGRWLDYAEKLCDAKLARLKGASKTNDTELRELWMDWKVTEQILAAMQMFPQAAIDVAKQQNEQ